MQYEPIDVARISDDEAYRQTLRVLIVTDLFFLTKFVLGYTKVEEDSHRELADTFQKKVPGQEPDKYTSSLRRRLILFPRKTYKTTFNIADCVQWVCAWPDIAIMAMTASNSDDSPLADAFVTEVAEHFVCADGEAKKILHLCFPEHVITKRPKNGIFSEFISPARTKYRRDPTLRAVSIEQSLSGWHPDIMKSEDVQDNRNSQTAFSLKKVRTNFYINLKMLGEAGFLDVTGTRYGPMDLYGDMIAKAGEETKVLWRPAYIRKPHALKYEEYELTEDDVILQFPRQLSWNFLQIEKRIDENSFWTQYMNVAEGNFKPTFPESKLHAAKVKDEGHQNDGEPYVCWRFEYAECKYAAGVAGIAQGNRMTIMEVDRGQYAPTALARHVVSMAKKWECHRVEIEDTPGAQSMLAHIRNEALEEDWRLDVSWSGFQQDETAKALAIKSAEPLLLAGRLLFAEGMHNLQEVFRQLYHFGMIEDSEIASVVARVAAKLQASIAADGFEAQDEEAFNAYIEQDAYNRVFGEMKTAEIFPEMQLEEPEEWAPQGPGAGLDEIMPGLSG